MRRKPQIISLRAAAPLVPAGPIVAPDRIKLWSPGEIVGDFGRNVWDSEAAREVMETYATRGNPIPIDLNHNSNPKAPTYDPNGPRGGYLGLSLGADGSLWLEPIAWSAYAREKIESGELRAISPDWDYDKATGRPVRLKAVALVWNPGTYGIGLMASASNGAQSMDLNAVITALSAMLTADDPKPMIEQYLSELRQANEGSPQVETTEAGTTQEDPMFAGMTEEQRAGAKALAMAAFGKKASKPTAAAFAAENAPMSREQIRAMVRSTVTQTHRELKEIDSLIASAKSSPGYTEALASALANLPLTSVRSIVGALPKPAEKQDAAPATAAAEQQPGGVKVGALAGAASASTDTNLTAREVVSIDIINRAARSPGEIIAEAQAAAGMGPDGKPKINADGSASFSALAAMGKGGRKGVSAN